MTSQRWLSVSVNLLSPVHWRTWPAWTHAGDGSYSGFSQTLASSWSSQRPECHCSIADPSGSKMKVTYREPGRDSQHWWCYLKVRSHYREENDKIDGESCYNIWDEPRLQVGHPDHFQIEGGYLRRTDDISSSSEEDFYFISISILSTMWSV